MSTNFLRRVQDPAAKAVISDQNHKILYGQGEILSHRFWIKRRAREVKKMVKLNKGSITQTEAMGLIDKKLNQEYADFISSNSRAVKVVNFNLYFAIQEGSVMGSVYFEPIGKLKQI